MGWVAVGWKVGGGWKKASLVANYQIIKRIKLFDFFYFLFIFSFLSPAITGIELQPFVYIMINIQICLSVEK